MMTTNKESQNQKEQLLHNINKIHTTQLGFNRIKNNLGLETNEIVNYCQNTIKDNNSQINKIGKNYYCTLDNIIITVNSKSYTIITAHKK